MKKFVVMLLVAAAGLSASAVSGNCMANAPTLVPGQSVPVTLVSEYLPGIGTIDGFGVCYCKVLLTRGKEYTMWIEGGDAKNMAFYADVNWEDPSAPFAAFFPADYQDGAIHAAFMYEDAWYPEYDPAQGWYYAIIYGDVNATTTLHIANGIENFVQEGEEGNPKVITMKDTQQTYSAPLVSGQYYMAAKLTAGRKYRVRTVGGTKDKPLGLSVMGKADSASEDPPFARVEVDPAYTNVANNAAFMVFPETTGYYLFDVLGPVASEETFKFAYQSVPSKPLANHSIRAELTSANKYSNSFIAGRENAGQSYYDDIIDEFLFKIKLAKNARWMFEYTGAKNPVRMRVYDANGKALASNDTVGGGSFNLRAAIKASAAGYYYVGVCNPALGPLDPLAGSGVKGTLKATNLSTVAVPDGFDPTDDAVDGANELVAYPITADSQKGSPVKYGSASDVHQLNATDWYDTYQINARKGLTYVLRASFADAAKTTDLTLQAKLFYVASGEKTVAYTGTLTPAGVLNPEQGALTFTATANMTYYLRVYVKEGVGLDYPGYRIHTLSYAASGTKLGLLKVNTKGADGRWALKGEGISYPNGGVINTAGRKTVTFTDVAGYKKPADQTVTVAVCTSKGKPMTEITGSYTDKRDPEDDVAKGATALTLTATGKSLTGTLWKEDPVDYFKIVAEEGVYYSFGLIDVTDGTAGDAQFRIVKSNGTLVVGDTNIVDRMVFDPGIYYLKVMHATAKKLDSKYVLAYGGIHVGLVQFTKASFSVKESQGYVDLLVNRTASEGHVRVNYTTEAITGSDSPDREAVPGKDYYPLSGELEWKPGDMAAKKITVKLVPDAIEHWESDAKKFNVRIWPKEEEELAEGEYRALLGRDISTAKVAEQSVKAVGTITSVSAAEVVGGEDLAVTFNREGGSQGKVAVRVTTLKGTAVSTTDYEPLTGTILTWEDGDDEPKVLTMWTKKTTDFVEYKTFTLKVAAVADEGFDEPAVPVARIAVKVLNPDYVRTLDEYAAETEAIGGAALSAVGDWFADGGGNLRSVPVAAKSAAALTFTLKGAGVFIAEPSILGGTGKKLTCAVNGGTAVDCTAGGRIVRLLSGDSNAVKFTYAKGGDGNAFVSFARQANGLAYTWIPLKGLRPVSPHDVAVVAAVKPQKLQWEVPAGMAELPGLVYRVRYGTKVACAGIADELVEPEVDGMVGDFPDRLVKAGNKYYWTVDVAEAGAASPVWVKCPNVWSFTYAAATAPATAVKSGTDAQGRSVAELVEAGEPIRLVQGVVIDPIRLTAVGGTASSYALVSGELPPGLVWNAKKGILSGAASKAGRYEAVLQMKSGTTACVTEHFVFEVQALDAAFGNFRGVLREDGGALTNAYPKIGYLSLTVASGGKISATVTVAGKSYAFSGTGYDTLEDGLLTAELTQTTTVAGKSYANTLMLEILDGDSNDASLMGGIAGEARLVLNVPDAKGVQQDIAYRCDLYRNNVNSEGYKAAQARYQGYYTVSLVPDGSDPSAGEPVGNGYLTMTVTAKNTVAISGVLADGTPVSGATIVALQGNDIADPASSVLHIPFYLGDATAQTAVGGVLTLIYAEGVVDEVKCVTSYFDTTELDWVKDGPASNRAGDGFAIRVIPAGGWYNTLYNLEGYYNRRALKVEAADYSLPEDMLPAGYSFGLDASPSGVSVSVTDNELAPEKRVLKKKEDGHYDMVESVNPWNATVKFVRETGLVSGTFNAWAFNASGKEKIYTLIPHKGVMLLNSAENAPLPLEVCTAGFYLLPVDADWSASLPFNILAMPTDFDWTERVVPEAGK